MGCECDRANCAAERVAGTAQEEGLRGSLTMAAETRKGGKKSLETGAGPARSVCVKEAVDSAVERTS